MNWKEQESQSKLGRKQRKKRRKRRRGDGGGQRLREKKMGVRGRLHKKKRKTAYMLDDRGRDSEFLNKVVSELRKTLDTVDNIKKMGRGQKAEDKQEKGEEEGNKVENEERKGVKKQKEEVKKKKKVERKRGMRETRRIIM